LKAETYRFLRLAQPTDEERADGAAVPPGAIHLPAWIDSKWCKQLVGEELVTVRTRRGFARLEWQKLRERNEALDCRVYARAAAWIIGSDRTSDAGWGQLERRLGTPAPSAAAGETGNHERGAPEAGTHPRPRRRRVGRVGGMSWLSR
jgi:phage terminase large subunit GpA-like protein